MNKTYSFLLTLSLGVIIGFGLTLQDIAVAKKPMAIDLPQAELQTFVEVYDRIKLQYVDDVEGKKLINDAVRGMLAGLDPHSAYLDKKQFTDLQAGTSGKFGGLGIEVTMEDGFIKVVAPIDDTPAFKAGIQSQDLIVRLDDKPVKGLSLSEAVDIMRGKPGTSIELTIIRKNTAQPLIKKLKRAIIKARSIRHHVLEENYGYVRITQFQAQTTNDLQTAINKIKQEVADKHLKGLILDLRNNPGGLLDAAIGVADTFLKSGEIVSTKGKLRDSNQSFYAEQFVTGDRLEDTPIVVLINSGSASASEIVAGALQDHKRAAIVGSQSFGKGSVQSISELQHQDAIKITTARYYTPSGRSIQAKGITPDIELKHVKVNLIDDKFKPIKESELSGHLENETKEDGAKLESVENSKADDDKTNELVKTDYQLYEALNILKGLHVLHGKK